MGRTIQHKAVFFLCMSVALFSVHAQTIPRTDFSKVSNLSIPFSLDRVNMPVIEVEYNGKSLRFAFCLSGDRSIVRESFFEKCYGAQVLSDIRQKLRDSLVDGDEWDDSELEYTVRRMLSLDMVPLTVENMKVAEVTVSSMNCYCHFYDKDLDATSSIDGLLGLSFFNGCRNMVIDYKKGIIKINVDKIQASEYPLRRIPLTHIYAVPVKINGVLQEAMLFTGGDGVYLCAGYRNGNIPSDKELMELIVEANGVPDEREAYRMVTVELGPLKRKIRGRMSAKDTPSLGDIDQKLVRKVNAVSSSFFKGHVIQLDFENGVFRIR